jgi:hypothetical protein
MPDNSPILESVCKSHIAELELKFERRLREVTDYVEKCTNEDMEKLRIDLKNMQLTMQNNQIEIIKEISKSNDRLKLLFISLILTIAIAFALGSGAGAIP